MLKFDGVKIVGDRMFNEPDGGIYRIDPRVAATVCKKWKDTVCSSVEHFISLQKVLNHEIEHYESEHSGYFYLGDLEDKYPSMRLSIDENCVFFDEKVKIPLDGFHLCFKVGAIIVKANGYPWLLKYLPNPEFHDTLNGGFWSFLKLLEDFGVVLEYYAPVGSYTPAIKDYVDELIRQRFNETHNAEGFSAATKVVRAIELLAGKHLPNAGKVSHVNGSVSRNTNGSRPKLNVGVTYENYPHQSFSVIVYVDNDAATVSKHIRSQLPEITARMRKLRDDVLWEQSQGLASREYKPQTLQSNANTPIEFTAVGRIIDQKGKLVGLVISDGKQRIDSSISKCITNAQKGFIKNVKAVTRNGKTHLQGNGVSLDVLPQIQSNGGFLIDPKYS